MQYVDLNVICVSFIYGHKSVHVIVSKEEGELNQPLIQISLCVQGI